MLHLAQAVMFGGGDGVWVGVGVGICITSGFFKRGEKDGPVTTVYLYAYHYNAISVV